MHDPGHLGGERLLRGSGAGVPCQLAFEVDDVLLGQEGVQAEEPSGIGVREVRVRRAVDLAGAAGEREQEQDPCVSMHVVLRLGGVQAVPAEQVTEVVTDRYFKACFPLLTAATNQVTKDGQPRF